jgi:hypothetical protein
MVRLDLIIALVFAGIALFIAARNKEWWLLAFAFVAGILLAGNKIGVTINTWINEAGAWVVHLFQ